MSINDFLIKQKSKILKLEFQSAWRSTKSLLLIFALDRKVETVRTNFFEFIKFSLPLSISWEVWYGVWNFKVEILIFGVDNISMNESWMFWIRTLMMILGFNLCGHRLILPSHWYHWRVNVYCFKAIKRIILCINLKNHKEKEKFPMNK